jgi:hypothetical protein
MCPWHLLIFREIASLFCRSRLSYFVVRFTCLVFEGLVTDHAILWQVPLSEGRKQEGIGETGRRSGEGPHLGQVPAAAMGVLFPGAAFRLSAIECYIGV